MGRDLPRRDQQSRTRGSRDRPLALRRALGVEAGARLLSDSIRYLPDDAIVLAVVDPPAAAHLAAALPLEALGAAIETSSLASLDIRNPQVEPGKIRCEVIDANRFGNVQLNVRESESVGSRSAAPRPTPTSTAASTA